MPIQNISPAGGVPDVSGLHVDDAVARIQAVGYRVTQLIYVDTNYNGTQTSPDLVYNQYPAAAADADINTTVALVVSTGTQFYGSAVGRYRFQTLNQA